MVTFVHAKYMPAVTSLILTKLFGPNFLWTKKFLDQTSLGTNSFLTVNLFQTHNCLRSKNFLGPNFWTRNFIGPKKFFKPKPQFFKDPTFFFQPQHILAPQIFLKNLFQTQFGPKNFFNYWESEYQQGSRTLPLLEYQ